MRSYPIISRQHGRDKSGRKHLDALGPELVAGGQGECALRPPIDGFRHEATQKEERGTGAAEDADPGAEEATED